MAIDYSDPIYDCLRRVGSKNHFAFTRIMSEQSASVAEGDADNVSAQPRHYNPLEFQADQSQMRQKIPERSCGK
jgi:hypothetical protein